MLNREIFDIVYRNTKTVYNCQIQDSPLPEDIAANLPPGHSVTFLLGQRATSAEIEGRQRLLNSRFDGCTRVTTMTREKISSHNTHPVSTIPRGQRQRANPDFYLFPGWQKGDARLVGHAATRTDDDCVLCEEGRDGNGRFLSGSLCRTKGAGFDS